jgi:uncharacterized protein YegP (UPF0339 family)
MKNPKATIHRSDKDGEFYYTIVSQNGEILVVSEMFTQKHNAESGIWGLIKVCVKLWLKHKLGGKVIEDKTK